MDLRRDMSLRGLLLNIGGALLVLAGVGLAAMTARGELNYRHAASRHGGEVIDLSGNAHPQAGQHGFMARVVATPKVVEAPRDPDFNLRVDTPVLVRHVEMFQWREVRIGDKVHYELDWVDRLLDSSRFAVPRGHANPERFPISGKQFDAGLVQVGGFKLAPVLVHALPGTQVVAPDTAVLPENLAASFGRHGNYLTTSAHPNEPRLGDVRVSWIEVPLQEVTVVARVDGDQLLPATDAADGKGYDVQIGDVPVLDLFPDLPMPPQSALISQVFALLLAAAGIHLLLLAKRGRSDVVLALGLAALVVGAVAAAMWLGSDMGMLLAWLLLALAGLAAAIWRHRSLPKIPG